MRESRYNIHAESDVGEHLLFNAATGAFAVLDAVAQATLERGEGAYREQLAESGFLTEQSADEELAAQQALFDAERLRSDELQLVIAPTYACNYRCPYCYEIGHNSNKLPMSPEVADKLFEFVETLYEQQPFERLWVEWYGGDPSLTLDIVEDMSDWFMAFCAEHGISYDAMMLTNCNIIDEAAADLLVACHISEVFLTIDGPEELHNARRVAADGSNSYEAQIRAAKLFMERGIRVNANMNADKINWQVYPALRDELCEMGIGLTCGLLNDYGHFYGTGAFASPRFELFTHEEFADERLALALEEGLSAEGLCQMLQAYPFFCRGQHDSYFVIDSLGDVYGCDGWMGELDHRLFRLDDGPETWKLHEVTLDATRDERCSACELLPICQGSCYWERCCSDMACHPLKTTIEGYLALYRSCFDTPVGEFQMLAR